MIETPPDPETKTIQPKHNALELGPPPVESDTPELKALEKKLRRKVDLRLCTIAGLLCSLNLVDSGILSSASVTSMFDDLDLHGTRYSVAIFIFTVSNVIFQLPSTMATRWFGPRIWFTLTCCCFGLITLCTAFIHTWKQMIALRVLQGISASGFFPGMAYLTSAWYTRQEVQLRYGFLQTVECTVMATGSIVNFGLNHLDGRAGLRGWRWMFLVQGVITCVIGVATYWWMVDFPEHSQQSVWFLTEDETRLAVKRIEDDRRDVVAEPFSWYAVVINFRDPKLYCFACIGFIVSLVTTAISYFLPIILQSGMGFSSNESILLSTPPYYYAVLPALITSFISDKLRLRGPIMIFNNLCLIAGFLMLGLPPAEHVATRYAGAFVATGAYVCNWAAVNAYVANNVVGQWNRATTMGSYAMAQGLGGVAGSFIVKADEAPRYETAVWVIVGLHLFMIGVIIMLSGTFWVLNRQQRQGKRVNQNVVGFRYTY